MTACLAISPEHRSRGGRITVVPAILSDVLATRLDRQHAPVIIPANVMPGTLDDISRVELVRKSYVLEGNTAVTFAGDGGPLLQCLHQVADQLPNLLKGERPMRAVGIMADDYGVQCIGASVDRRTGQINWVSPIRNRWHLQRLGACAEIGSGGPQLRKFTTEMDGDLEASLLGRKTTPYARAKMFALSLRDHVLTLEVNNEIGGDWGGYIESLVWNSGTLSWERGASAVHFFFKVHELEPSVATVKQYARVVAYDPGGSHGRIASLNSDGVNHAFQDYVLADVFAVAAPPVPSSSDFWSTWVPTTGSISISYYKPGEPAFLSSRPLINRAMDGVHFGFDGSSAWFNLPEAIRNEICGEAVRAWGFRYVPPEGAESALF